MPFSIGENGAGEFLSHERCSLGKKLGGQE
jgi:hypothetical protein